MRARFTLTMICSVTSSASVTAQQMPVQPVFNAAIIHGPSIMAMGLAVDPNAQGRVCGQTYSNDLEKVELKRQEALGQCAHVRKRLVTPRMALPLSGDNKALAASTFRFSPSAALRSRNLARFIAQARTVDPNGAFAMERLFASADVIGAMGQALKPLGLRTDDVADAYAVRWMSAWQAAHRDTSMPSRAKAQAVRAQVTRAFTATPEFTQADDAAKQEYAEALLVQTALIDGMVEQYGSDPELSPKIASSVRQGARASGLDLDAVTLTEQGFVPAKKTGAADPAPGAPREALAAAGGAGLGAAFLIGKAMKRWG